MPTATRPLWSGMSVLVHAPSNSSGKRYPSTATGLVVSLSAHCARWHPRGVANHWADLAHLPSPRAPLRWAVGGIFPWLLLAVGQVAWFEFGQANAMAAHLDRRRDCAGARSSRRRWFRCGVIGCTGGNSAPQAVYTRTGWLVQERRDRADLAGRRPSTPFAGRWTGCSGWPMSPSRRLRRPVRTHRRARRRCGRPSRRTAHRHRGDRC